MGNGLQRPEQTVDSVLTHALRSFMTFPGPGLAYFAIVALWDVTGNVALGDPASLMSGAGLLSPVFAFIVSLLIGWFMCGLTRVAIAGVRGQPATWNDTLVSGWEYFHAASALGAWLSLALLGLLFMIVPGIFAFLIWSQAFFCAIDRKQRWLPAMGHSRTITRGHYGLIFAVAVAIELLMLPGQIFSVGDMSSSLSDLQQLLADPTSAASGSPAAAGPAVFGMSLIGSALGAAASTAMCYVGAALYVALQDPPPPPPQKTVRSSSSELPRAWPTSTSAGRSFR